jgi:hypothetical protein
MSGTLDDVIECIQIACEAFNRGEGNFLRCFLTLRDEIITDHELNEDAE